MRGLADISLVIAADTICWCIGLFKICRGAPLSPAQGADMASCLLALRFIYMPKVP